MSDGTNANDQNSDAGKNDGGTEDLTGLKTALQAERDARKAAEKSAKDLQTRIAAIENSGKSEAEKLTARLEALEKDNATKSAAIRDRDAKDAARDMAKKAGAPDGDLIYRVVKGDIEYDDDGRPNNLNALIDDLKKMSPNLFKVESKRIDGGAGSGHKPKVSESMNSFIRSAAGRE